MKNITIDGSIYCLSDSLDVNLSDSFVSPNNKIGSGSGEARLYISSQNHTPLFSFSKTQTIIKGNTSYPACISDCYLVKENLIDFLNDSSSYYFNPVYTHRRNLLSFYSSRENTINQLDDLVKFHVYMQNGDTDSDRFYIGSIDNAWTIIRELGIPSKKQDPAISHVKINKYINTSNPSDIKYLFLLHFDRSTSAQAVTLTEKDIEKSIKNDTSIDSTEKISIIKARKGQGKFRSNVLSIMPHCPFTNITNTFLLRASHIKPWHKCSSNEERLNGYNGLTLSPTYDTLFDLGFISFTNDGKLLISDKLDELSKTALNLDTTKIYNIENTDGLRNDYLEFHRNFVFKK